MAVNNGTLLDGDGESSDWIEVFNRGDAFADLTGWHLTDDPSDLSKWTFPSTVLTPGDFLIVFASGKDMIDSTGAMHTNFSLDDGGDYLALVHPDGTTVVSQFGSSLTAYPKQESDVSYGIVQDASTATLVSPSSSASTRIPVNGNLGTSWTEVGFVPDANWVAGHTPVGYDTSGGGTALRVDFNDRTSSESGAADTEAGFATMNLNENGKTIDGVKITFTAIGGATLDDRDRAVPTDNPPALTQDQLYDDFIFANGTFDGAGLQILIEGLAPNAAYDLTLWSYDNSSVGQRVSVWTELSSGVPVSITDQYVFDGNTIPGSDLEDTIQSTVVSSASGTLLLQGVRNGGTSHGVFVNALELSIDGFGALLGTDLQAAMHNTNASAFTRIPFDVPSGTQADILTLGVQYDAGFIAYLNGQEIARRNAPTAAGVPAAYNAAATLERASDVATQLEQINVTSFANLLNLGGTNVLAIHGMNSSASDSNFLIGAALEATSVAGGAIRYFDVPTPGAANVGGFEGFVADTSFDIDRGFFTAPFQLTISTNTPGATIYYTTNGTIPGANADSQLYQGPIAISTTTTVRAIAMVPNYRPSNVDTQTYIFLGDVLTQDPLANPNGLNYPTVWQGNATGDYNMDPEVVAAWDDFNPANDDFGIREALQSLPTMSIVMDHDDLWNGGNGIYPNATSRGDTWRRPGSIEYFDPATGDQFQYNVGVQMHGNASRDNARLKKHSFRLIFSPDFDGPGRLDYPLFDNSDFNNINTVVMRASFTDAFATRTQTNRYSPLDSQYTRDVWMRDTFAAMGQPAAASTFVHLYINGLYWGMYSPAERPDDAFWASHYGGQEEDWDVIKDFNELFKGNKTAWNEMFALADQLPSSPNPDAIYWQLQGRNPDGTHNPNLPVYLDMDNLADFMLVHIYGGAEDWPHHNWYAARNRVNPGDGFQFTVWDQEIVLDGRYRDVTNVGTATDHQFTPAELYHHLKSSPEFRALFADRVQLHMFNGGALSVAANQARWTERSNQVEAAIIGESARWGDAREGEVITVSTGQAPVTVPVMTVDLWRAERDNVRDNYFPTIQQQTIERLQTDGLYSSLAAPDFNQHGGLINPGFPLEITTSSTAVTVQSKLVSAQSSVTAWVPTNNSLDAPTPLTPPLWTLSGFNDTTWLTGTNGVGYERDSGLQPLIGLDLLAASIPANQRIDTNGDNTNENNTVYTRLEFDVPNDLAVDQISSMQLLVNYDDGFAAYLNGTLVASSNAPATLQWNATASASHEAAGFESFDVTPFLDRLLPGQSNVLAIHVLNLTTTSTDMFSQAELIINREEDGGEIYYTTDGTDPRLLGGAINSGSALVYSAPVTLNESTRVMARTHFDGTWSALTFADFSVVPAQTGIVISEINYHPYAPTIEELDVLPDVTADAFEFIEIFNAHPTDSLNVLGMQLSDGVQFTFASHSLAPGDRAVVVEDLAAFRLRYGEGPVVVGKWSGGLSNNGETITLVNPIGDPMMSVLYADSDPWPRRADGVGGTLELTSAGTPPTERLGKHYSWQGSANFGGSPGTAGSAPLGLLINEVRANSNAPGLFDAIELWNTASQPVSLDGMYLSDSAGNLLKYALPSGVTLAPGEFYVVTEPSFNPTPATPAPHHFALSSLGDDVWLIATDGNGHVTGFVDELHFGATQIHQTVGRTSLAPDRTAPLERPTLGCENPHASVGPIVISELHYRPVSFDPLVPADDLEFVELYNSSASPVSLNGWRMRGGVDFDFTNGTVLGANETLVILSFNPNNPDNADRLSAFRSAYAIGPNVAVVGGYNGSLSRDGERVELQRAGTPEPGNPAIVPYYAEDEVLYDNLAPWPTAADGQGPALARVSPVWFGSLGRNWTATPPTPGTTSFSPITGDFDGDGLVTANDIDRLAVAIESVEHINTFDLNGSGTVDQTDLDYLLTVALQSQRGDANLDGVVDVSDFNIWNKHKFNSCAVSWSQGDFTGDGAVDGSDLNQWLAHRFTGAAAAPAPRSTPRAPATAKFSATAEMVSYAHAADRVFAASASPKETAPHAEFIRVTAPHPAARYHLRRDLTRRHAVQENQSPLSEEEARSEKLGARGE
jgi:hypothetical protein